MTLSTLLLTILCILPIIGVALIVKKSVLRNSNASARISYSKAESFESLNLGEFSFVDKIYITNGLPFIKVNLNSLGDAYFLLDTGANINFIAHNVVSNNTIANANEKKTIAGGIGSKSESSFEFLIDVSIGNICVKNLEFIDADKNLLEILKKSKIPGTTAKPIGILGTKFILAAGLVIDLDNSSLYSII